jgi:hypothetical protein
MTPIFPDYPLAWLGVGVCESGFAIHMRCMHCIEVDYRKGSAHLVGKRELYRREHERVNRCPVEQARKTA